MNQNAVPVSGDRKHAVTEAALLEGSNVSPNRVRVVMIMKKLVDNRRK